MDWCSRDATAQEKKNKLKRTESKCLEPKDPSLAQLHELLQAVKEDLLELKDLVLHLEEREVSMESDEEGC